MNTLIIEATDTTPFVYFDKEKNIFKMEGKTLPENVNGFYEKIKSWLNEYLESPNEETVFEMKLEYINTASSKAIFSIFLKLEQIIDKGKKAKIIWYYADDDEDMLDVGEEYSEVIKVPFEFVEFEAED